MNARLVLFLLAIALPATARAQMVSVPGVVVEATPIRIDPTATVPLTTLPRGMDVVVIAVENGWVQVAFEDLRYGRRVGYVPKTMVSFEMPGLPAPAQPEPFRGPSQPVASLPPPVTLKPAPSKPAKATTRAKAPTAATETTPAASAGAATAAAAKTPAAATAPAVPAPRPPVRLVESEFPAVATATSTKKPKAAAGTTANTTPSAPAAIAPATPAVRPPVRLVENDFPASVAASPVASPKLRPVSSGMTPSPATTPATPAALAPVRLVEGDFPSVAPSASSPAPEERQPASRVVIPIGDAFPEATGPGSALPAAPPSSPEGTAPSEQP